LIDEKWVESSITPSEPYLMPGVSEKIPLGYGYQWWIPGKEENISEVEGDFLAIGVYNQFMYVSPKFNIVIVRNSAYPHYDDDSILSELQSVSLFRTIAKHFAAL